MPLTTRYGPGRVVTLVRVLGSIAVAAGGGGAKAAWEVKADPPAEQVTLAVKPGMAVTLPNPPGMATVYPTTVSPFLAVGQNTAAADAREVWDLRTFRRAGVIKGKIGSSATSQVRLSPDGKYLAVTVTDTDPDRAVEVYGVADGKLVTRIEPKPRPKKILAFDFGAGGRLLVATELEGAKRLQAYDTASGAAAGLMLGLPPDFQDSSLAMSPGRKYAAFLGGGGVRAVAVETMTAAGHLAFKGTCNGLAFSPDGTELAGLFFSAPGGRLVVWDVAKGEVVVDHALPSGPGFATPGWQDPGARPIDWLPDGSAWLLAGHAVVNRKDGRWVWSLFAPSYKNTNEKTGAYTIRPGSLIYSQGVKLVDNDHALAALRTRAGAAVLEVVKIPWPQIDASLKAVEANAPALLGPGKAVSLRVNVGATRFSTPQAAREGITEAITDGLAAEGIKLAAGQPVVLNVSHSEEAGPSYRIVGPRATGGASVTSTKFITEVFLTVGNSSKPVWSAQKGFTGLGHITTTRKTGGRTDEQGMREGGFEGVKESLKSLGLPYFIPLPKDKTLAMLPGTTVLTATAAPVVGGSGKGSPAVKVLKPTTRGRTNP